MKFSDKYMDLAFLTWYEMDRPSFQKLKDALPTPDTGEKIPSITTLQGWFADYGWEQRADAIAGEESEKLKDEAITRRVEMFKRLERGGNTLVEKSENYWKTHEIESDNAAIKAMMDGADLLRASVGQAEAWLKIGSMTNIQLESAFRSLLDKGKNDFSEITVDTESVDGENISEEPKDPEDLSGQG